MESVEQTFRTLHSAFAEAVHFFSKGVTPNGAPLTQQQAVDVLEVYDTLLSGGDGADMSLRTETARCSLESGFAALLTSVLAAPLSHVHEMDAQLPQPFLPLRMKAALSLQRLLLACGDAEEVCGHACLRLFADDALLALLLRVLGESPHDPLRAAVGEVCFVFVLRVRGGAAAFAAADGIPALSRALAADGSGAVRAVCASVMREVVSTRAGDLIGPATVSILTAALADAAAEVRVLAAEVLQQALRQSPRGMAYVLREARPLLAALRRSFGRDASVEAVEAAARLMEECCVVGAHIHTDALFALAVSMHLARTLLRRIAEGGNAGAACARALRFLVQYTPAGCELPRHVLQDADCCTALLKGIVDAGRGHTTHGEDYAAFQVKSVELAMCLGIILTQSPEYRDYLATEFQAHAQWAAAIKNAAVSLLNTAALDYFAGMELQDIHGCHMNTLDGVVWGESNTPQRFYVQEIFDTQAKRTAARAMQSAEAITPNYQMPILPDNDAHSEEDRGRKARLTFVLLVYAINVTFPVESKAAVNRTGGIPDLMDNLPSMSPSVQLQLPFSVHTRSSAQRERPSVRFPTGSRQREYVLATNEGTPSGRDPRGRPSSRSKRDMTPEAKEAMAIAYDKFNSSMAFVMQYTQHYKPKSKEKEKDTVETEDGYLVHVSRLKNPWKGIVENQRSKTWEVSDLKVGDLFYFSISFDEIGIKSLDAVIHKARRHMIYIKKEIVTTPQTSKGRRWFLHDMMRNVMPKALEHLEGLKVQVGSHGGDGVRFPIFLFREKELHFGERALHPGNLVEVVDQVAFYFSRSIEKTLGVDKARLQSLAKQLDDMEKEAYMDDVDMPPLVPIDAAGAIALDDDEDDAGGYGHGTISSESEEDF